MENAFGLFYDDPFTLKVRFPAEEVRYIKERQWSKDQEITELEDGSIVLTMKTSGWYDVMRWVFSFGPNAEVIEPKEMRDEIKKRLDPCQQ